MAKITSHTDLNQGTEFDYNVSTTTLTLSEAGNLVEADGVDLDSVFSAAEDEKRAGSTKNRYRFPLFFTTGELGNLLEIRGGWTFTNHSFLRDGGVRHRSGFGSDATVTQEYACIVGLGTNEATTSAQFYVLKATDTAPTNLGRTGLPNELVKIYDSAGDDDRTSLIIFARPWGYTWLYYDLLTEQPAASILPVNYNIPTTIVAETNGSGTNGAMQATAFIDANTPYTGMGPTGNGSDLYETLAGTGFTAWANATAYAANSVVSDGGRWYITTAGGTSSGTGVGDDVGVTWVSYSGERAVDGTYYAYKYIHDANSGTIQQYYEFHQRSLLKTSDIDASASVSQRGDTCAPKVSWVNGKLRTATGHFIDNIAAAQAHLVEQTDIGGTVRAETFTPTFTVNCVDADGASTNFATGTRLYIYDETNTNVLYNGTPGAVSSYAVSYSGTGNATIRVKAISINGSSGATEMVNTTATQTDSANASINITQTTDSIYVANGVDGSAVTGLSINANKIDVDANVAANTITWQSIYAWYQYYNTTSAGIADSDFLITANTQTSYTVDTTVEIKNTNTGNPLVITGADVADTNGSVTGIIDTSGENIYLIPETVVAFASGSSLTPTQETQLATASAQSTAAATDAAAIEVIATEVQKILKNRQVTDSSGSKMVIYDDDDTTPLLEANLADDASGNTAWTGDNAINFRDRLQTP